MSIKKLFNDFIDFLCSLDFRRRHFDDIMATWDKDEKPHGHWMEWNDDGSVKKDEYYIHGRLVTKSQWEAYEAKQK